MGDTSEEIAKPLIAPETTDTQPTVEKISAFAGSVAEAMMERQKQQGLPLVIANTDIDNSFQMSPKTETTDERAASERLACTSYEADVPIHAITGAGYDDVMKRIQAGELPWFPILSNQVGTKRYILKQNERGENYYEFDEAHAKKLAELGYDRHQLAAACAGSEENPGIFQELNMQFQGMDLAFQHPDRENGFIADPTAQSAEPYKLSGYFFASDEQMHEIQKVLEERFPGQRIVVCEEIGYNASLQPGDSRKKRCLDIVPITKAEALADVASTLGAQVAITTGDSGNDITMLKADTTDVAVIAGGAKQELITSLEGEFAGASGISIKEKQVDDGGKKLLFQERNNHGRRGPQTTLHALDVIMRASQIHMGTVMKHYNLQANGDYQNKKEWLQDKRLKVQGKKPIDPLVRAKVYSPIQSK